MYFKPFRIEILTQIVNKSVVTVAVYCIVRLKMFLFASVRGLIICAPAICVFVISMLMYMYYYMYYYMHYSCYLFSTKANYCDQHNVSLAFCHTRRYASLEVEYKFLTRARSNFIETPFNEQCRLTFSFGSERIE